ncbi:hypothetical protein BGZ72_003461, partial [Mortierella alpina]
MKLVSAVITLVALASSGFALTITPCAGTATDSLQVTKWSITPDPPQVGAKLCLTAQASLSKAITADATIEGNAKVVSWDFTYVQPSSNFCQSLSEINAKAQCPIQPMTTGAGELTYCVDVPAL